MAIDPKELRIGSHVSFKKKRIKIVGIPYPNVYDNMSRNIYWRSEDDFNYIGVDCADERLTPIPITPELLTELGFEYRDNTYWERWFKGGFDIERKEDSKYFDYSRKLRLESLHELENLYYMIYGVELIND